MMKVDNLGLTSASGEIEAPDIPAGFEYPVFNGLTWVSDKTLFAARHAMRVKAIPSSVSPRQIRQALTRQNLRNQVETVVATGDQDLKDWWEFSTEFLRYHPQVITVGELLGKTPEELDKLWVLAASL